MDISFLKKIAALRRPIYNLGRRRAEDVVIKIMPYLAQCKTVLEFGAGTCNVAELLTEKGFILTIVDIKDLSFVPSLQPIIYDGRKLPFLDATFDVVTLLDVLHHTKYPDRLLNEAKRVSNRVIVMESVYTYALQKLLFLVVDSLLNMEFMGHPWNYRMDKEWRSLFTQLGFGIIKTESGSYWLLFKSSTYVLESLN